MITSEAAGVILGNYVDIIEDQDPERYACGNDLDRDQDAMDGYTAILRLMLPDEPAAGRAADRARAAARRA